MEKSTKQVKAEKAKAEEAALTRILYWVLGGAVLEFLLLLLNRYWVHYTVSQIEFRVALGSAVKILAVAALCCAAAAAFWWNAARKSGKSSALPGMLGLFLLGVSLSCFAAWIFSGPGIQLMYILVPVIVVLVLIFYLYQHEFFLVACESVLALLGIWICSFALEGRGSVLCYAYIVVAVLLLGGCALLCKKAAEGNGKMEFKGKKVRFFGGDANYTLLYVSAALLALVLILAAVGISQVVLYSVAVAWLLVMAVYYTVKLM